MIDKNERKKKYLLQYGSLLLLHLAIQKAQGGAIEAAGAGGLWIGQCVCWRSRPLYRCCWRFGLRFGMREFIF